MGSYRSAQEKIEIKSCSTGGAFDARLFKLQEMKTAATVASEQTTG
jgi:hypothetical protein